MFTDYTHRTEEEFQQAVSLHGIERWNIHRCSQCNYECGYLFGKDGKVQHDSGCDCVGQIQISNRTYKDVVRQYNIQTSEKEIQSMDTFWKFKPRELLKTGFSIKRGKTITITMMYVFDHEKKKEYEVECQHIYGGKFNAWIMKCNCRFFDSSKMSKYCFHYSYCPHIHATICDSLEKDIPFSLFRDLEMFNYSEEFRKYMTPEEWVPMLIYLQRR